MMLVLFLVAVVLGGNVAVIAMYAARVIHFGSNDVGMTGDVFIFGASIGGAAALAGGLGYLIAHAVGARHLVLMALAVGVPGGLVTGALARSTTDAFGYTFAIAGFVVGVVTFTSLVLARRALRRRYLVVLTEETPHLVS